MIDPAGSAVTRAAAYSVTVQPPVRVDPQTGISVDEAVGLASVYRALDILTAAAGQLPLQIERMGETLTPAAAGSILARPSLSMSQSEFVVQIVLSLATRGNAYIRRVEVGGKLLEMRLLNAAEVAILTDTQNETVTGYSYRGKVYRPGEVEHVSKLRLPGRTYGLGPIQAAQQGLSLASQQSRFASEWFDTAGQPEGILQANEQQSRQQMIAARNGFNNLDPEGQPLPQDTNPTRIRVLNSGWKYEPLLISPKDALWLEAQNFSTLEVARLFGVPTSLMYVALEGNSQTYANVEQEWLAFSRFTLMGYLRPIENALTNLSPAGQRVKFNLEGLLRSDTRSRYDAYAVGIQNGFIHPEEVRDREGFSELTPAQQADLKATAGQTTKTTRESNA